MVSRKNILIAFSFALFCISMSGCKKSPHTLFRLLSADDTGIDFSNTITETDSFNILTYEYIYNGGGVAVADFNNDGLQDIFFTGNEVPNKLYINRGNLKFEDITATANVNVSGRWNSGVVVVDINNDGLQDIYVCATRRKDSVDRANMLFINKGGAKPVFEESAIKYGIADTGYSTMAAFFDYDKDGDLDLYVLTNQQLKESPNNYRPKMVDGSSPNNDRLYRNNGNGTFTNVSNDAGILIEGFGLGLAIVDINVDGWPDIYVSNDFLSNDILYVNNQDGTFTNKIGEWMGHQSNSSMGNDAADINNDGYPDVVTVDMLPETNDRIKTTINNKSYQSYVNNEAYHYEYQYVRNMLQLSNGKNADGTMRFSEIGQMAGVYQTEWSWCPLFVDVDNDGYRDLLITNGFPKDITDKDFSNYRSQTGAYLSIRALNDSIPVIKIPDYAFKNNGDLTFRDVSKEWGFTQPSFSNGAVTADLDNDGDLDYVVNNINEKAFVFENQLYSKNKEHATHYLRVKLNGTSGNRQAIGSRITIFYDHGKMQYLEHEVARGYLSSVEGIEHFGLGTAAQLDSIKIQWPDGRILLLKDVPADQVIMVSYEDATAPTGRSTEKVSPAIFKEISKRLRLSFKHSEADKIDFNLQRTLPHKFSQYGPGIAVGDVNGDLRDDMVLGGSAGNPTTIFIQQKDGTFVKSDISKMETRQHEDEGLLLFDADGDNDQDLVIVSGSIESRPPSRDYQARFYRNKGNGKFVMDSLALPTTDASGSCVRAADIDSDGDLDLFIGGRVVPGRYPYPAKSYIFKNDCGTFTDATAAWCPEMDSLGMVTDALFTDFNQDGKIDLMVAGEFMPVTFFRNDGTSLTRMTDTGINDNVGWWNSIAAGDFDHDGDIDYIAGNLGTNNAYHVSKDYPLKVYAKDFDKNGSIDAIMSCYIRESMSSDVRKLFPIHFWDELNSQSPRFRQQFSLYKQYCKASMEDIFTQEDLQGALILSANYFATSYIENNANGKFAMRPLSNLVQVAPVNGMVTDDVNNDGNLDIVMIGNDYGNEVFVGRYDAFEGLVLFGDGKGGFKPRGSASTGFFVKGDAKGLSKMMSSDGREMFVATQNKDSLRVFMKDPTIEPETAIVTLDPLDSWAEFVFADERKVRTEFYYGSGFLSQSSRRIKLPPGLKEIIVHDFMGRQRTMPVQHL